jgi:regulator of sirC expression with transglutaminase-like and TPR domain
VELSEKLKTYLAQPNPDLFEASLLVARHVQPGLVSEEYIRLIDNWAQELEQRLKGARNNKSKLRRINDYLFKELGFSGNHNDYYDPRNSMINHVIERRKGIPITMAVLYITLAQRVGLNVVGASFPGHFLVKMSLEEGLIVLDPFNKGVSLGEDDLKSLLEYNNLTPDTELLSASLRTASMEETILRMLRNLKAVYLKDNNQESGLNMLNIMLSINPELVEERRERGLLLHEMGCNHTALIDLESYMKVSKKQEKIEAIRPVVVDLIRNTPPLH